jgi:hypothetical protein
LGGWLKYIGNDYKKSDMSTDRDEKGRGMAEING